MTFATATGRVLRRLVRLTCARPVVTLVVAGLLAAVSVVYAVVALTFSTSNLSMLPPNQPYVQRFVEYGQEFGDLDNLSIAVEASSPPEAKLYANRLVRELKAQSVPLKQLTYRIDPQQFEGRALLYLSVKQLKEIRDKVFDYQEFMENFAARPTLDQLIEGISSQVANDFASAFLDLGLKEDKGPPDVRLIQDLVSQIGSRLEKPAPYKSPWASLFATSDPNFDEGSAGYFLSEDQKILFILAEPESAKHSSFTADRATIDGIRAVVASLATEFPRGRVGVTGKAALANDEMVAAFRDSQRATILAFVLTLGLLLAAFLRVAKPLVMLLVLVVTLCWSIGAATLVIGHLSLFSVMFISIVIGIGIDYGIYFLFRYDEEIFLGRNLKEAIEITAMRTGPGMLMGAVTAAGTFYVLMLTDFRGIQELGFIAGTAIAFSFIGMMTVFPAALVILDAHHAERGDRLIPRAIALERMRVPLVDRATRRPKLVLGCAIVLTLVSLWGARTIRFDYNLLNLQSRRTESVVWERKILQTAHRSGFAAITVADSLDELRRKQRAFSKLSSVSEVDSALLLIPDDQDEKRKIIRDLVPIVGPVRVGRPRALDVGRLIAAFETLQRRIEIGANEAPPGEVQNQLRTTVDEIGALLVKLRQTDVATLDAALTLFQQELYRDFVRNFQRLQANLNPRTVGLNDLPEELRRKFVSDRGRFMLQIHPAIDIWDRQGMEQWVGQLRSIDPAITGTPIITYEAIRLMERGYQQGTFYAVILVVVITFLTLRHVKESVLSLVPLALGMTWTLGIMSLVGLPFNMGNVFGLPLILGAAVEFGLNIVMRFMEGREHGGPLIARSTVMAVLVNGLTTTVGFGSLMIADHRGIWGLGFVLATGAVTSLVAALVVLPVLLRMTRRLARRPPPPSFTDPIPVGSMS